MRRMLMGLLPLCLAAAAGGVQADEFTRDAAIGGAIGGAAGAAIGAEVGGREGAIIGGAIGGATGTAITTNGEDERRREVTVHERRRDRGGGFCPPGLAKQGRC